MTVFFLSQLLSLRLNCVPFFFASRYPPPLLLLHGEKQDEQRVENICNYGDPCRLYLSRDLKKERRKCSIPFKLHENAPTRAPSSSIFRTFTSSNRHPRLQTLQFAAGRQPSQTRVYTVGEHVFLFHLKNPSKEKHCVKWVSIFFLTTKPFNSRVCVFLVEKLVQG